MIRAQSKQTSTRLVLVVNDPAFFLSHRLPIALAAQQEGFVVHVATAYGPGIDRIAAMGLIHHILPLSRSGKNPLVELRGFIALYRLFRKIKPDIVHLVTIKPLLYGSIAARLAGVPSVVAAVSGLGFVYLASGLKAAFVRVVVSGMYRLVLGKHNLKVIFQNLDDRKTLMHDEALQADKVVMIRGSGVDLSAYTVIPAPKGLPVVAMVARLLRDKGVYEYAAAAQILKQRGLMARFWLVGAPDVGNPASVDEADLSTWYNSGVIELLGYKHDVAQVFAQSNIVVLPSYREGLPKVLIEAAACGRPVVTTDVPGCRDAIEPDVTGLLVPPRNAVALADAIQRLLLDAELRARMGQAGRRLAEREFSVEKVVAAHMAVYRKLMETAT